MNLRVRGRRGAVAGAGAAALTAAAVFVAPAAVAAPADDAEQAVEEVQEQARQAVEEAEQALEVARQEAENSTRVQRQAEQAVEEAQQALEEARQQAEEALDGVQQDGGQAVDDAQRQTQDALGDLPTIQFFDWLPDNLQQARQGTPASDSAQELDDIVQDGLSGDYRDEAGPMTERLGGMLAALPPELRRDIQDLRGQEPEETRAEVRRIVERAVDGEYGAEVQKVADWMRETAQRWDLAGAIQGRTMDMPEVPMDETQGDIMDRIPDDILQRIPSDVLDEMRNRLPGNS